MESDWIEYKCKSDQPIFLCNKVTGVHKWPPGYNDVSHSILFVDILDPHELFFFYCTINSLSCF